MKKFRIQPGTLELQQLRSAWLEHQAIELDPTCFEEIHKSQQTVQRLLDEDRTVYGINTGFGLLANTRIDHDKLGELQRKIVLSHSADIGKPLDDAVVRLVMLLKINSLARGFSGIRLKVIERLICLYNEEVYPMIPSQGSVGASGDLAPLAHMSCTLIGYGQVHYKGELREATDVLQELGLEPMELGPKEGLALLNGTQVSTALALVGLFICEDTFSAAVVCGSLSVDAAKGSIKPFDPRIHAVRGQRGQSECAAVYRRLLEDSQILHSHENCKRVQDPYSLRCQPQVMGAILDNMRHVAHVLKIEANAVSDNPLVFSEDGDILSGGNFHAEPVAIVADLLAICLCEIGALSERRMALLIDSHLSGLPPFLVEDGGLNSGFMIAQVTSAALTCENKMLSHPASVDSLPTSANQEDHVSMATHGARRLKPMADNAAGIIAIEYLAACQGIDLRSPLKTSKPLQKAFDKLRTQVPMYKEDRYFASDIDKAKNIILDSYFNQFIDASIFASFED